MSTATIGIASFTGTATLNIGPGTATTNAIKGTFNFKKASLSKASNDDAKISYDFESDGPVTLEGFSETSAPTVIQGWGGSVTLPSGFGVAVSGWSADINVDTVTAQTFDSIWKQSSIVAGNVTGSLTGFVKTGLPVPTTSVTT